MFKYVDMVVNDKYEKYKGKTFCVEKTPRVGSYVSCKIKFRVVGYCKGLEHILIGKLVGRLGVTADFTGHKDSDFIEGYEDENSYVYVNVDRIEKNPTPKKIVKKKERKGIDMLDFFELTEIEF